jgi:hypothetical protein
MKASDLKDIIEEFDSYYIWSPSVMGVHFGCSCGCGGTSYTVASWEAVHKDAEEAYKKYFDYCKDNNIEWDYD